MNKETKRQSIYEGASILLISTVLAKIISALFKIPLSANFCLGDLGFGYFSAAHDFFTPIHLVAVLGFPVAISKMITDFTVKNELKNAKNTFLTSRKLLIGFSLALVVILAIGFVVFMKSSNGIYSYFGMLPCVLFCFTAAAYKGYYEGQGNMNPAAVSNVIEALGKLLLGFGFALAVVQITGNLALGAAAAMVGITIGSFFSLLYLHLRFKKENIVIKQNSAVLKEKKLAKTFVIFAIPVVLSSLSAGMVALVDSITVRWSLLDNLLYFGYAYPDYAQNLELIPTILYGIRSKAFTLYNLIPTLTMSIGVGAVPVIAAAFAKQKKDEVKKSFASVLKLSALISLPAAAGFIGLGKRIMTLLYGEGTSADIGGWMLLLYGFAVIFAGISIPLGSCLQAIGKQKASLINVGIGLAVKLIGNIALCSIKELNIYGSALSTIACYLVILVLHLCLIIKETGRIDDIKGVVLKPLVSAVCCGLSAFLVSLISSSSIITIIAILVAAVIYLLVLSLLNTFEEAEILALSKGEKLLKICKRLKIVR